MDMETEIKYQKEVTEKEGVSSRYVKKYGKFNCSCGESRALYREKYNGQVVLIKVECQTCAENES